MSHLLSAAKKVLKDHAIEFYNIMGEDIPLVKEDFTLHYYNLGVVLFNIESIQTVNELFNKLSKGDFSELGYCSEDEDLIEEFLRAVYKEMK